MQITITIQIQADDGTHHQHVLTTCAVSPHRQSVSRHRRQSLSSIMTAILSLS